MKMKQLNDQLASLKIMYEDAIIKKASSDELKSILQKIDEVSKRIALLGSDRLH